MFVETLWGSAAPSQRGLLQAPPLWSRPLSLFGPVDPQPLMRPTNGCEAICLDRRRLIVDDRTKALLNRFDGRPGVSGLDSVHGESIPAQEGSDPYGRDPHRTPCPGNQERKEKPDTGAPKDLTSAHASAC